MDFSKSGNRVEDDNLLLEVISSYLIPADNNYSYFANLANISALLFYYMENINWAGFYLYDGQNLILGPFQGEPACSTIPLGKGVCGTSALKQETIIVPDVSRFPGHIACSSKSRSEIVIPIVKAGRLIGVIDIDSPALDRFSKEDEELLNRVSYIVASMYK